MKNGTRPASCLPPSSSVSVGWTASTISTDFDQRTNHLHQPHPSYAYTPGRQSATLPNRVGPPRFLPIASTQNHHPQYFNCMPSNNEKQFSYLCEPPVGPIHNSNIYQRSITSPLTFSSGSAQTQASKGGGQTRQAQNGESDQNCIHKGNTNSQFHHNRDWMFSKCQNHTYSCCYDTW